MSPNNPNENLVRCWYFWQWELNFFDSIYSIIHLHFPPTRSSRQAHLTLANLFITCKVQEWFNLLPLSPDEYVQFPYMFHSLQLSYQPMIVCANYNWKASDDRQIGPIYTLNKSHPKLKHWLCSKYEWEIFVREKREQLSPEIKVTWRKRHFLTLCQCHSALWAEIVYCHFEG